MSDLIAILITLAVIAVLTPAAIWGVRNARRSKRAMAPLAGMMMLLGAFFTADPPPPPRSESIAREEEDEDGAADGTRPEP
ncbi:hypothetical protein ACN2C7_04900 [Caulobacter sp. ErkDOM-E]|uniref:hypothetical protein n=1 Tax=Caulobacter sp. ErkDOM-E TaxID=3402778 RepID=UPI003AF4E2A7